jgi:hypothetical protein
MLIPSPVSGEVSASYADGGGVSTICPATPSVADYRDTSPETGEGAMVGQHV